MMDRRQKKCLIASAALHGLLLLVLIVGPAFLVKETEVAKDMPILDVIPRKLIDEMMSGGGTPPPQPKVPEPQPPKPQPKPQVERAQPKRQPKPEPKRAAIAPKEMPREIPKDPPKDPPKPKWEPTKADEVVVAKNIIQPSPKPVPRQTADPARISDALNRSVANLKDKLSTSMDIDIPGTGGEAYANYAQYIKSLYDKAWVTPDGVSDDSASVRVEVVIAREGRLVSDRISRGSGAPAMDRSVQMALDRVRAGSIRRFPEGAKDRERTFLINFNLQTRR